MLSAWLARWHLVPAGIARPTPGGPMRIEVCPPALLQSPWPDVSPLCEARLEFIGALRGVRTPRVGELRARLGRSHSLRELWHLRADAFDPSPQVRLEPRP
ncbi:hypothetical protein [Piscinibacter sp.]|jgi:hypothetical protein|uniref:hypothetical protein n=1 Tax=Piscinibacter sp. TaxID=1903157 RepID=UPI00355A306D